MLKLDRQAGPFWLDLVPGVRIEVEPISVASMLIAREAAAKVLGPEDAEDEADDVRDVNARASVALVRELCLRGIKRWEGVGDADGTPAPVTPENIGALLDVWQVYDALDLLYVTPALRRGAEKNESENSPRGTSSQTRAPTTAPPAES